MLVSLQGKSWAHQVGRVGLPILVAMAKKKLSTTYTDWAALTSTYGPTLRRPENYGAPAGVCGDACEEYFASTNKLTPPINVLITNRRTKQPGIGADYYLKWYLRTNQHLKQKWKEINETNRDKVIWEVTNEVFSYRDWDDFLSYALLRPAKSIELPLTKKSRKTTTQWLSEYSGKKGRGETQEHKDLKKKIIDNPQLVNLPQNAIGKSEIILLSEDRVDIMFAEHDLIVEAKTSAATDKEIVKGIYQCIKYRELWRAQRRHDKIFSKVDAILVTPRKIPHEILSVAKCLAVKVIVI